MCRWPAALALGEGSGARKRRPRKRLDGAVPPPPAQVFEGKDGAKVPGFEAFHRSTLHTSPLLYDIDFDGVADIVAATYDGEILFFKDTVRG